MLTTTTLLSSIALQPNPHASPFVLEIDCSHHRFESFESYPAYRSPSEIDSRLCHTHTTCHTATPRRRASPDFFELQREDNETTTNMFTAMEKSRRRVLGALNSRFIYGRVVSSSSAGSCFTRTMTSTTVNHFDSKLVETSSYHP